MSLLIKNWQMADWKELLMWAKIGANNAMIGEFAEVEELPPHGRLGDLNSLAERLEDLRKTTAKENPPTDNHGFNNGIMCGIGAAINEVRYYTPTVIPAEEEP